jgi:hypothetical protein
VLEHPPQTLGRSNVHSEGVPDDSFQIEIIAPHLERVENLSEIAAILGHGRAVDERALSYTVSSSRSNNRTT